MRSRRHFISMGLGFLGSSVVSLLPRRTEPPNAIAENDGVRPEWFDNTGGTDFARAFRLAQRVATETGSPLLLDARIYRLSGSLTFAEGLKIQGVPGATIRTENESARNGNIRLASGMTIESVDFDLGASKAQVIGSNISGVRLFECAARNGSENGFYFRGKCSNIILRRCFAENNAKSGIAVAGTAANAPLKITVNECLASGNGRHGITVSGVGENSALGQSASYAEQVTITNNVCNSNGDFEKTGAYSGIVFPYCRFAEVLDNVSHNNAEHGISCQETSDFVVKRNACHKNGQAGFNAQSGYAPHRPSQRGLIRGNSFHENRQGIALKEVCVNLTFIDNSVLNNSRFSVELRDLGQSGLHSDQLRFIDNKLLPTRGRIFANRNHSTNVIYDPKKNGVGQ